MFAFANPSTLPWYTPEPAGRRRGSRASTSISAPLRGLAEAVVQSTRIGAINRQPPSRLFARRSRHIWTARASLLRQRHRLLPLQDNDFAIRNLSVVAEAREAGARTLSILLASVALVSLLTGGIGILNIMLVSVTERTREIGVRMAVGARRRDILLQFLFEAAGL